MNAIFNKRMYLEEFVFLPGILKFLEQNRDKEELYWKNRKKDQLPGLVLFRSDLDDAYSSHNNEDLVVISLVSYDGSKDYTGKKYSFVISQLMNGRVVATSYRTLLDTALDVYDTYAREITKSLKLSAWLTSRIAHELDSSAEITLNLLDGKSVPQAEKGDVWEYLFMFFKKEMKQYFLGSHNKRNIALYEAKRYPLPDIDATIDVLDKYHLLFVFEDGSIEHQVKNPLIEKAIDTLFDNRQKLINPVKPQGKVVKLENKKIVSLADIDSEELEELRKNAEVLSYETELMENIKETAPENYADEKLFWDVLLTFYARHRMQDASIEKSISDGFREAMEYWSKDIPKQNEKWIPVHNPYKEDEIRFVLNDNWNGDSVSLTKWDIQNIMNALS